MSKKKKMICGIMIVGILIVTGATWLSIDSIRKHQKKRPATEENQYLLNESVMLEFGPTSVHSSISLFYASVAHICETQDTLSLSKIVIQKENGEIIKSFTIDKQLEATGKELKEFQLLKQEELNKIRGALGDKAQGTPTTEWYPLDPRQGAKLSLLSQSLRKKSYSTGYFEIDLKEIKNNLEWGDKIPIRVNASIVHNNYPQTLSKKLLIEYTAQ